MEENVVSLFQWALYFDFVSKFCQDHRQNLKIAPTNTGNNIFFNEKVQRFQNKADTYFATSWEDPSLLSCFFVYEHAHLTADYRGRDLASLRHRRVRKAVINIVPLS